jgi:hypothetical protein
MSAATPPLRADRVEVTIARRELEIGAHELEAAIAVSDPREQRERVRSAVGHFALAARALDEICERRKETSGRVRTKKGTRMSSQSNNPAATESADEKQPPVEREPGRDDSRCDPAGHELKE